MVLFNVKKDDVGKTLRTRCKIPNLDDIFLPMTLADLSKIVFPIVHKDSRILNLKPFTLSKSVSLILIPKLKTGRTRLSKGPHCVLLRCTLLESIKIFRSLRNKI